MLPRFQLPFHPSIINCLAWSEDGDLAIAADDFVHILVPRRRQPGKRNEKPTPTAWEHVQFRANTFTTREWPLPPQGKMENFSIGEELSTSTVTALAWSPPGLAMHRRPVLTVLTSNLLLSFWVPASGTSANSTWQRVLVLNNSIKKSYKQMCLSKQIVEPPTGFQRKTRVRSMAWAPQVPRSAEKINSLSMESRLRSAFLLAVATDDCEVLFLLISSPYTPHSTLWDSKIVKILRFDKRGNLCHSPSLAQEPPGRDSEEVNRHDEQAEHCLTEESPKTAKYRPSLFKSALRSRLFFENIAWGPWNLDSDQEIVLTFTRREAIFHCFFHVSFIFPMNTSIASVPRFSFKRMSKASNDLIGLVNQSSAWYIPAPCEVSCVVVNRRNRIEFLKLNGDMSQSSPCSSEAYHLAPDADRWTSGQHGNIPITSQPLDGISGHAFCYEDQTAYMYLSTHLSHIETIKLRTYGPENDISWERLPQSTLHNQMIRYQIAHDRREDLGGLSVMKTWGLASFRGYIAACITVHPGDMAEYYMASQQRATVVFSLHGLKDSSADFESFPWEFDPEIQDEARHQVAIVETVFKYEKSHGTVQNEIDHKIIYAAVVASMLIWDEARLDRLMIAQRALLRLEGIVQLDLSPELSCLDYLQIDGLDIEKARIRIREIPGQRSQEDLSTPTARDLFEPCSFCDQAIRWESLTEAYCVAGHQFARCSLTFLAIREPGVSKYCQGCNRAYLNDHIILNSTKRNTDCTLGDATCSVPTVEELADTEIFGDDLLRIGGAVTTDNSTSVNLDAFKSKPFSLATMLFDTFDICPYCGGKFVG